MGDFNDVRSPDERFNSEFVASYADCFNDFIEAADLLEYHMGGYKFTYMSDKGDKLSKLDRMLVCRSFMNLWPVASLTALSKEMFDHCPLFLSTVPVDFGHIPFRFFNSWLDLPCFEDFIAASCNSFRFSGPADLALVTKLKWLKGRIKGWLVGERKKRDDGYRSHKDSIVLLEKLADTRSLSHHELDFRAECKKFVLECDLTRQRDIQQKSRVRWALEGDENSSFFHGIMNANTSNNRINGILVDGSWETSPSVLKDKAFEFFADKFKEPVEARPRLICPNLSVLSVSEADSLIVPFCTLEIRSAVWDCDGDRAPGPDGFNFKFLKRCWGWLELDFVKLFEEFHHSGSLNPGCTASFLALVPKLNDPVGFSDFRPISLIGIVNKVVSKVLVNRLKRVIQNLVSEEQSAFLAGRSIMDGPLILNEVISWLRRSNHKGFIFKVDIEKAFDSLNWEFLDSVLTSMNFPSLWRKWVMALLTSSRASVLVNGSPTREFSCYRGLRQGDPLSPFLFILAMEAFSGIIKQASSIGLYHGIVCGNSGPSLSHFLYADDVIFLGAWERSNAINLVRILRCFYLVSGLRINLGKSSLFGTCVDEGDLKEMALIFRCQTGSFPFKHLGLQVGANMNLIKSWKPVVEKFQKRLSGWRAKNLSFGGRVTLIKSVLNSLPMYYFSLYRAPVAIIDRLEKIRPISYGGLGLGSLRDANLAMLAKWWWRFKNEKGCLWRNVIWALHQSSRSWNFIPARVSTAGPWKQIYKISVEIAARGIDLSLVIKGILGCGDKISFWSDCWIGEAPLRSCFPNLFPLEKDKHCRVADRLIVGPNGVNFCWSWSRPPARNMELAEWYGLLDALSSVSLSTVTDRWSWLLDVSGVFTVKSVRSKLQVMSGGDLNGAIIWNNWVPKKVNILAWRANLGRLPTRLELAKRNIPLVSVACSCCGEAIESVEHLFVSCALAQSLWHIVSQWCKIPSIYAFEIKDLLEMHKFSRVSKKKAKMIHAIVLTSLWCLWKARNTLIFEGRQLSLANLVEEVKILGFLWVQCRSKSAALSWEDWRGFKI
ncbi:hypothetical protein L1987_83746 [Smallanthus sonchifolius]|uniref:Uncharacterized protein n=1 Tax=Smallanthus sonchifolius TaxID=185202 RepID=A0ACB8YDZ0_9ASTR|nr:hypothetical protein L1987_83746 [Smallanthus sonchifolius]